MKSLGVSLLFLCLSLSFSKLLHFKKDELEQNVEAGKIDKCYVFFRKADCPKCDEKEEIFSIAATHSEREAIPVDYIVLDTENNEKFLDAFGIKHLPFTVLFSFTRDLNFVFSKIYSVDTLINDSKVLLFSRVLEASSMEEIAEELPKLPFTPSYKVALYVGSSPTLQLAISETARNARISNMFITYNENILGPNTKDGIYIFKYNRELSKPFYSHRIEPYNELQNRKLLILATNPPLRYLSSENINDIGNGVKSVIFIHKNAFLTEEIKETLIKIAYRFLDLDFFEINWYDPKSQFLIDVIGREVDHELAFVITEKHDSVEGDLNKFVLTENFTYKNIETFIENYETGKLAPWQASELEIKHVGRVIKLTGNTLEEYIKNTEKQSVLLICKFDFQDCANALRFIEVFADKLKRIQFFAIDSTYNDISLIDFIAVPTTYYFPSGPNKLERRKEFERRYEFPTFAEWLKEVAGTELPTFVPEEIEEFKRMQIAINYKFGSGTFTEEFKEKYRVTKEKFANEKKAIFVQKGWINWNAPEVLPEELPEKEVAAKDDSLEEKKETVEEKKKEPKKDNLRDEL